MTVKCAWCGKVKSGSGLPISHGLCLTCQGVFFPDTFPKALMAPKATRSDCRSCYYRDLDSDGVPDGCDIPKGQRCIAPGKRDPWGIR